MSLLGASRQAQLASQFAQIDQPTDNRLKLAGQLRFRQMERTLQQTLEELEQAKARIGQLEKELAQRDEQDIAVTSCGNSEQQTPIPLTPPLPIAEISQLAEMAKRFR